MVATSPYRLLLTVGLSLLCLSLGILPSLQAQELDREKLEFFETKIRPVLVEHCYECHSSKSPEVQGGFLIDSRNGMLQGGDSDVGIVPGKPHEGTLLDALSFNSFEMPPSGKLPESVIADFEKWISDGAVDPRESAANSATNTEIDLEKGREFWSFKPIENTTVPETQDRDWSKTSIDKFVLAKLEEKKLKPAPEASRVDLVRRIYFDLIGLPPTPDEIDQFLNDRSEDRLEQLVDRLLERPQFGERWARHWLDVARYSDSSGGGRVLMFHDAWQYRDYVINAMNEDKPYDQFVREQLAGDLLPFENREDRSENLTATGFLALGPHNYELQDKELLRMEIVDEQIDVMGRAMMGMTLGCVRCHDHKFDPIPIEDYYALAGIFRSTHSVVNANVSRFVETSLPLPPEKQAELDAHAAELKVLKDKLAKAKEELAEIQKAPSNGNSIAINELEGVVLDDLNAALSGKWSEGSLNAFVGVGYQYSSDPAAAAVFETELTETGRFEVLISFAAHPNRGSAVPVLIRLGDELVVESTVNQRQTPEIDGLFHSLGFVDVDATRDVSVTIKTTTDGCSIIDSVRLVRQSKKSDEAEQADEELESETQALEEIAQREIDRAIKTQKKLIEKLEAQIKAHRKSAPKKAPIVMSVGEHDEKGDYFVCIRGNAHKLGDKVPRRALSVLPKSNLKIADEVSGRLELAQWLSDPQNPLTARVYVNRIWLHLFGEGLVRTPDNFGSMGELPSHPELLDYLAKEFVEDGWSTKNLIRKILLSRVYSLTSLPSEQALKLDPENRLLSHANRRRLDAEAIRDSILCFSGNLDTRSLGPSMKRDLKQEFGYQYKSLRRTVYLPIFRNTLNDMLDVFDFPNPNIVKGKRAESTLPTQALYMMNSPFVVEQARAAAKRIMSDADNRDERLQLAYRLSLGRTATRSEREIMEQFLVGYETQSDEEKIQMWAEICQTLISSLDFRFIK